MDIHSVTFVLLSNGLALGAFLLQSAILLRMDKTGLRREMKMFFGYVVFSFVQSLALTSFLSYFGYRSLEYYILYWSMFVVDTTLAFFIIHEIYAKALYRYDGLRALSAMIFRWAFMILTVIAAIYALSSRAAQMDWISGPILILDRSALFVEVGLVLLLFGFARTLAVSWRECIFGIAVGMCFYCSMQLVAVTLRTYYGIALDAAFVFGKPVISVSTLGIWMAYVYRAEKARREIIPLNNSSLDEWNAAVLQFLNR